MIHIYTGCGKGKTTAAIGLAVRGSGAGMNVYFMQLLKNGSSSEIGMLRKLGIKLRYVPQCEKFTFNMNTDELTAVKAEHNKILENVRELIISGIADMIVIDEFFGAYDKNLLDRKFASELICNSKFNCELILTGRNAPDFFVEKADYVTVMESKKHPYDKNIAARKGIEY